MKTSVPKIGKVTLKGFKPTVIYNGTPPRIVEHVRNWEMLLRTEKLESFIALCHYQDPELGVHCRGWSYEGDTAELLLSLELLRDRIKNGPN